MSREHAWTLTVLAPARLDRGQPEVRWWPHCKACGAQVCKGGGKMYYRASSAHEWTSTEPRCPEAPPGIPSGAQTE